MLPDIQYKAFYENSVYVQLDEVEINTAALCGRMTYRASQDGLHHEYHKPKPDGPNGEHIQMLGELAAWSLAKYLDRYPMAFRTYKGADMAGVVEARLIGVDHYGLRVYTKDVERGKLVVGVVIPRGHERRKHRIAGWIPAEDAAKEIWWSNPGDRERGFYCVPQDQLHHIDTIKHFLPPR